MKRRKKWNLIGVLVITIMLVMQSIAYAGTTNTRGMLLSSFEVSITDRGYGRIGIYGAALCHEPMKEIRMDLYLDVWNASENDWEQIESYQFSWNEKNSSLDERSAGVVSFDVTGLERGRDYQVRGAVAAFSYDGGHESWRAESGDIQVQSLDNLVTE